MIPDFNGALGLQISYETLALVMELSTTVIIRTLVAVRNCYLVISSLSDVGFLLSIPLNHRIIHLLSRKHLWDLGNCSSVLTTLVVNIHIDAIATAIIKDMGFAMVFIVVTITFQLMMFCLNLSYFQFTSDILPKMEFVLVLYPLVVLMPLS